MIQIKHIKLRIPTGGRLTSWLFIQCEELHFSLVFWWTIDKSRVVLCIQNHLFTGIINNRFFINQSVRGMSVIIQVISDKWDIGIPTTRECCITILYHVLENTVGNTIKYIRATYAQRVMGRLDVVPSSFTVFWLAVYSMTWCRR